MLVWRVAESALGLQEQTVGRGLKLVSQFVTLGLEVAFVMWIYLGPDWQLFHDLQPIPLEAHNFLWVVGVYNN